MDKQILRTDDGLIQLVRCPVCRYMVMGNTDIIWKRQPLDMADQGEILSCRFCSESRANTDYAPGYVTPKGLPEAKYTGSTENGEKLTPHVHNPLEFYSDAQDDPVFVNCSECGATLVNRSDNPEIC